jgi:hypothetical protein
LRIGWVGAVADKVAIIDHCWARNSRSGTS